MGNLLWGSNRFLREDVLSVFRACAQTAAYAVAETLWPTRCVICERAGDVICGVCQRNMNYIDQCLACPKCAAPYGYIQCTECNRLSLGKSGVESLSFQACVSSVLFDDHSSAVVRGYKDGGEQRLSLFMGYAIACSIPPEWVSGAVVVPIPATSKARLRRGFDHGLYLGEQVAAFTQLDCIDLLVHLPSKDQRGLGRSRRFSNLSDRFVTLHNCLGLNIILVDDVLTTGSTLHSAAQALVKAGAASVKCATFARVL